MPRPQLVPEQAPESRPTLVRRALAQLAPQEPRRWQLAGVGLLLLHLGNPLAWRHPVPMWWFPPVGIGLVLVAWLGPRALALIFADTLLVALQARLFNTPTMWGE